MWFNGPIVEAINKAKLEKTLLIVYVHGKDEKSASMTECWQNVEIGRISKEKKCVALKFDEKSQEARQFSEFYPVVCVPTVFFIDCDGRPLEIIAKPVTSEELKEQLLKAIALINFKNSEQKQPAEPTSSVVPAGSVGNSAEMASDLIKRAEDARNLIKHNNEKLEKEELDSEKARELTRREDSKTIVEAREKHKEREILAAAEERKRDKKADQEYLRLLREQIAADRLEKKQRYEASKEAERHEEEAKNQEKLKKLDEVKQKADDKHQQEIAERNKVTKLQFRLPDGYAVSEQFESTQCLSAAYDFVLADVLRSGEQFYLVQMYPRREFTDADLAKTFLELDLAPSSTLMIMQEKRRNVQLQQYQPNWFTWFFSLLTYPVIFVYNWLYSVIFGGSTANTNRNTSISDTRNNNRSGGSSSQNKVATKNDKFSRQDGNVHRMPLPNDGGPPDDNATWNGNSTQQM